MKEDKEEGRLSLSAFPGLLCAICLSLLGLFVEREEESELDRKDG